MEIDKLITLSTAHLPEEYAKNPIGWFHIASNSEGFLMCVPHDPCEECDDTESLVFLLPIFKFAARHGVSYIWFDCDGPIEADLPQFDW